MYAVFGVPGKRILETSKNDSFEIFSMVIRYSIPENCRNAADKSRSGVIHGYHSLKKGKLQSRLQCFLRCSSVTLLWLFEVRKEV